MTERRGGGVRFGAAELTAEELSLQAEVRAFLAAELGGDAGRRPGLGMNGAASREFSRKLGARGWLGMALPKRYGGAERSAVDRFVVTEELLRYGAPVGHHWLADRQTGAVINRFGTQEQKARFLPGIASGELGFSVGLSEPGAGSDLAAIRTRAVRDGDGWVISGQKVWTTGAHRNDYIVALCRTSDEPDRRDGLTQFIVSLSAPGLAVHPIALLDGSADFNEVVFDDVAVGPDAVLGDLGRGWSQTTAELALERGGPDRFMSIYPVVEAFLREMEPTGLVPPGRAESARRFLGRATATFWVHAEHGAVHRPRGRPRRVLGPPGRAAEGDGDPLRAGRHHRPARGDRHRAGVRLAVGLRADPVRGDPHPSDLHHPRRHQRDPALGGGQGHLGRFGRLGRRARGEVTPMTDSLLTDTVGEIFAAVCTDDALRAAERDGFAPAAWDAVAEAGLPWISVPEAAGGEGGDLADALAVLRLAGYHGLPLPLAETGVLAGWLLATSGLRSPACRRRWRPAPTWRGAGRPYAARPGWFPGAGRPSR